METETLDALKESIAHWKRLASGKRNVNERPSEQDCALCGIFLADNRYCDGCPVKEATGQTCCEDTPFWRAWEIYRAEGMDSAAFKLAAAEELAFLESLLP